MNIEHRIRNYEILIRFNENGSLGSHLQEIEEILKEGEVISATPLAPVPLSFVAGEGLVQLQTVLGEATTAALANNIALQLKITELYEQVAEMKELLEAQRGEMVVG